MKNLMSDFEDLKKQYINECLAEYWLLPTKLAISMFLESDKNLRKLVHRLRYTFPPELVVFFEPKEAELRQRATADIISFLSGEMSQDEFLVRLESYIAEEDDQSEN